jgi:hypothetical protein
MHCHRAASGPPMSVSSRSSTSSSAVAPYAVRSKYAFTAAEDVEISAAEGEILVSTARGLDEEWVLVGRPGVAPWVAVAACFRFFFFFLFFSFFGGVVFFFYPRVALLPML